MCCRKEVAVRRMDNGEAVVVSEYVLMIWHII